MNRSGIEDEFGFEIRRPVEVFPPPDRDPNPNTWFERNRLPTLRGITITSDDMRVHRQLAAQMLSELWTGEFSKNEIADGLDQLLQIVWIQHWATFIGLLSGADLRTIRFLSENGHRRLVTDHFTKASQERHRIKPFELTAETTRESARQGKLIGMFHGTFAPPTWVHFSLANYYHQLCDELIIGIDADELAVARKGPGRNRFPFIEKYSVWGSFPNIADHITEVPERIFQNGDIVEAEVIRFYRDYGIGIVFFNGSEPQRERRLRQIENAGAIPFDKNLFEATMFSSTKLMNLLDQEGPRIRNLAM